MSSVGSLEEEPELEPEPVLVAVLAAVVEVPVPVVEAKVLVKSNVADPCSRCCWIVAPASVEPGFVIPKAKTMSCDEALLAYREQPIRIAQHQSAVNAPPR